ncbi:hypothetical protein KY366_02485 [Candidatus Woesearchaeota archaeon]|nr:hypothetical protein [Candidatus Woesearchaeota archaeon]
MGLFSAKKGLRKLCILGYIILIFSVFILLSGCIKVEQSGRKVAESEDGTVGYSPKAEEEAEPEEPEEIIKIPNDIREMLERAENKLKSYSYNYKGPASEIAYQVYVNGDNMKIVLPKANTEEKDKRYNTVYLDMAEKTAQAYCIGYSACEGKTGKIKDLDYGDTYIETPKDWLDKIERTEKIDERRVEGRDAVYLETNAGRMVIESYYGFLYKVEDGSKVWEFTDAKFNSVGKEDVMPS